MFEKKKVGLVPEIRRLRELDESRQQPKQKNQSEEMSSE
jgi:hypothetical protein